MNRDTSKIRPIPALRAALPDLGLLAAVLIGILLAFHGFTTMGLAYGADTAASYLYRLLTGSAHALAGGCTIGIAFAVRTAEDNASRIWCPAAVRWALIAGMLASVAMFVEALGRPGAGGGFWPAPGWAAVAGAGFLVFLYSVYGMTTRRES